MNDGIPDAEASISYDFFSSAAEDLVASGRGSLLGKLDLRDAFKHIPVRRADWHLLGYTWREALWYDIVLVFGLRSAPYIFNLFAEALHWIIRRHIPGALRHYLDDFLPIFPPSVPHATAQAALKWIQALGSQLGLSFQDAKTLGPATQIEFLGLELDSAAMEARLPPEKLAILAELLTVWKSKASCTLADLQELIGFLQFAAQVIPMARAFIRRLIDFSMTFRSRFSCRRILASARADLTWWTTFAASWNGVHLLAPPRTVLHIYTDASGTKGIGGVFRNHWFSARVPRRHKHKDIQFKELLAVAEAVDRWGDQLRGAHIVFHVDNDDVVVALTKFTNRSPHTMDLLCRFLMKTASLDLTFSAVWLSSAQNALADFASPYLEAPPADWYDRNPFYSRRVAFYLWYGLASSTRRTYSTGQKSFLNFAVLNGFAAPHAIPATQPAIMEWVCSLAGRVEPKTIKAYLSHVRSLHVDNDLPFAVTEASVVQRLIRGIKRFHGERDRKPKLPITLNILTTILSAFDSATASNDDSLMLGAACRAAFAGFLRCGEFTVRSEEKFSPAVHLTRSSVFFHPSFADATFCRIELPASKTDPFRKGVSVVLAAAPGAVTCPVAALKRMFTEQPAPPHAPLFMRRSGKPLTRGFFIESVRSALLAAEIAFSRPRLLKITPSHRSHGRVSNLKIRTGRSQATVLSN
ncbi:putative transposition, RNA-mediated [Lyophyllum shimeji]|uniref:Transposition, RNA-mediated n=1 Tax=Lyophyllum shimeji TaxID=47721 RepID=A0A9P3Q1E8_LYOSH|nr:putative transposition, RNA-mediated [Lyophyllum shimeji]